MDNAHGLVQALEVTPANVFDGHMLMPLVDSLNLPEEIEVLADKGYCSQENEDALQEKNLVSKIMQKKKEESGCFRANKDLQSVYFYSKIPG